MAPRITLHFVPIPGSRADRLFFVLEELGLKYDAVAHPQKGPTSPTFKELAPLGKSPALEIDGTILTETGSIITYLLNTFPHPSGTGLESTISHDSLHWSFFSEGTLMLHLQPNRVLGFAARALPGKPGVTKEQGEGVGMLENWFKSVWVGKNVALQMDCVEEWLAAHPNFTGGEDVGAGDIMMHYPLNHLAYDDLMGNFPVGPKTREWVDRIRARPAWQRATERQDREVAKSKAASKPKM